MGLKDDKREVLTKIGSYVSLIERLSQPNDTDLFPSVNVKKDVVPYLIDVLKTVAGGDAVKDMVGEMFADFTDTIEPKIKTTLVKQLTQPNFSDNIPSFFLSTGTGIDMPVKSIDVYGKLKINPNSDSGKLLYELNTPNFDDSAHDALVNDGMPITYNGLIMEYNKTTDTMNFKTTASSTTDIGDWLGTYVNDAVIINKKEFLSNVMDSVFGSVTSNANKSKEQVFQELQIQKLLEQLIINDDDSFVVNQEDFDALLQKAQELIDGVTNNDLGCGILETSFPISGLTNYISLISGSTDSYENKEATQDVLNESVLAPENGQEGNRATIEDSFFQKLIRIFTQLLISIATTSPQIRMLMGLITAFTNNGIAKIGNALDDLKDFKVLIKCIKNDLLAVINEFIFNIIKNLLNDLLKPIIILIIREKINQYVGMIKSLINVPT